MKSCFMFGHADCPDRMLCKIEQAVEYFYATHGVTAFYVGSRGRFDSLAATAVQRVKQHHADVRLYLILAYHPAERPIELSDGFDGSYYPLLERIPRRYAIVRTNHDMVDNADCIICYVNHIGNTRSLLEYVKKRKGIHTKNVAEDG